VSGTYIACMLTNHGQDVLQVLQQHRHSWLFAKPVDPMTFDPPLDDYFSIVKAPMDFSTIEVCDS